MVTVPESLLRRATAKIDSLDREIIWAHHELALRDSMHAIDKADWLEHTARIEAWGEKGWKQANSWWHKHESAFWAMLGALAVAFGLSL